jgi:hypothetical protein
MNHSIQFHVTTEKPYYQVNDLFISGAVHACVEGTYPEIKFLSLYLEGREILGFEPTEKSARIISSETKFM